MSKRALLVGIDTYDHWDDLSACVKDVQALAPRLTTHEDGTANFSVTSLVSSTERIDRPTLMRCVRQELLSNADVVLLYFAGHGAERAGDVILCTQEGNEHDEGVAFSALLGLINGSGVEEVIVILDCCFSGGAGSNPVIGSELSYVRPGVAILSASRHDEVAQEMPTVGQGRFSYFLCAALDGGSADVLGNVGVIGAYAYLRESFGAGEQSPTFKCNVAKLHRLRRCHPAVSHAEMLRLPKLFGADPAFELRLNPAYEPTSPPVGSGQGKDLRHSAALPRRQAGRTGRCAAHVRRGDGEPAVPAHGSGSPLPAPSLSGPPVRFGITGHQDPPPSAAVSNANHMDHATMESKSVRLTALRKHCRRLTSKDLI